MATFFIERPIFAWVIAIVVMLGTTTSSIPARMALLREGKVRAAVLPEPLASLAVAEGAVPVADDVDQSGFLCSVVAFRRPVVASSEPAIRAFLRVMDRACGEINRAPDALRQLALDNGLLPPSLATSFVMQSYPVGRVPSRLVYEQAADWLRDGGRIHKAAPYEGVVLDYHDSASAGLPATGVPSR